MRRAAVLLAALVLLGGCAADAEDTSAQDAEASTSPEPDATSPSASPKAKDEPRKKSTDAATVPADAPACAAVWRDGTRLARDYEGCMAGGDFVAVDQEPCSFGQRLVRYGDHFYAVRGGPGNRTTAPLDEDRVYRGALASCRG